MSANWHIGERLAGRWEVHQVIKGGMGVVCIVYDHEQHGFLVAKTFQDELFARGPHVKERFRREALAWVGLDKHENVTRATWALEIGLKPFLFLEYVSGGDLRKWIGTPRLMSDLPQIVRFAIQFCDGMIHAARSGIAVHRDIKPENCLITEEPILKITDFGLAKALDDTAIIEREHGADRNQVNASPTSPRLDPRSNLGDMPTVSRKGTSSNEARPNILRRILNKTHRGEDIISLHLPTDVVTRPDDPRTWIKVTDTGDVVGTPLYMAPEQFDDSKHVDVRADVYSFGVMLFEMIGGRRPFAGKTFKDLEARHKHQNPPELGCSEALEQLVQSCLTKDPSKRPANFQYVREQLSPLYEKLTGQPAPPPRTGSDLDVADLINKSSALITLDRPADALACCERAVELDRANANAWSAQGNALHKLKRVEEALSCFEQALQINPSLTVAVANIGSCLLDHGRFDEALACFDRAIELHAGYTGWAKKGEGLRRCGRFEEALFCCERALELNPREVTVWTNKGTVLFDLGRSAEALQCLERALELNPRDHLAWYNKAIQLSALNRSDEALTCYERANEVNPQFEPAWVNKADVLERLGRSREALDCCARAVELDPHDNKAWGTKGRILAIHEKYDEALKCFDRLLELNVNDHDTWFCKAKTLSGLQRWEEALYSFDRALAVKPEEHTAREKAVVVGYLELSRSGVGAEDLKKAMQFRKDARLAGAAGRRMTLEIESVIRNIVSANAASIANFNERREELANINLEFLLYYSIGLVLWFGGAARWTEERRDTVIQNVAEELAAAWMLQATAKATPESINKDSENKTAGFAAALRTVFGNIRDFFDRLGNLKEKKAFEQLTLFVTLQWLTEVYPACATFLGKGEQSAEREVLMKLLQTVWKLSLYLPGEMLKKVVVV